MLNTLSSSGSLQKILSQFKAPVDYCFGYGSGVFSQGLKSETRKRQIDIVFGVKNAKAWHSINVEQYPEHYSFLKYFGPSAIANVQNRFGAGVYYNPFTEINGHTVKYGVVETNVLKQDLEEWKTLYLAGRMHKPVVVGKNNSEIAEAQKRNLMSALSCALLLLPSADALSLDNGVTSSITSFTELDLYMKVASVSYLGDVRMAFAEHPKKVFNIVDNQFALFRELYTPFYEKAGIVTIKEDGIRNLQKTKTNEQLVKELPLKFRSMILSVNSTRILPLQVSKAVAEVVRRSSFSQSLKGILTAGPQRSIEYAIHKLKKRYIH